MRIKWSYRMIPDQHTTTGVMKHELTLRAVGSDREIEWLNKQLKKIGKHVETDDKEA